MTRIGWIGTGRMGAPMARRLARGGADLGVWNRTRARAEPLAADGATVVDDVAALAGRDVVFTMVAADADLEEVTLGDDGLLTTEAAPRILVDCSTVSADTSAKIRAAAAERGTRFLAAPVSGNGKVAAAGRLSFVVSGPEDAYDEVAPLFDQLGTGSTYAGEGEAARLVKICHNLLLGVVAQSLAEITVLAQRYGVPRHALLAFVNGSVLGSAFTRYKSPQYVHLDFGPTFTTRLLRKDFDLGLDAAREARVPMPVAALVAELVQAADGAGHADEDFAVLLARQAEGAGLTLEPEDVEVDDGLSTNGG